MQKILIASLCLLFTACGGQNIKKSTQSASNEVAGAARTVAGGAIEVAKEVKDAAVGMYHGTAELGKTVAKDATEAGQDVAKKAKETFGK